MADDERTPDGQQAPAGGPEPSPGGWLPPSSPGSQPAPAFGPPPAPNHVEGLPPAASPQVEGLPPAAPSAYPYVPPPGPPPAGGGWPQGPQPGWYQPPPSRPTNGAAVAALVLGVAGIVVTLLFAGFLFIVSMPCSIAAWVFGVKGRRAAAPDPNLEPTRPGGRGMAQAGIITGIVGLVLAVLAIVFWVLIFSLGSWDFSTFETEPDEDLFQSLAGTAAVLLGVG